MSIKQLPLQNSASEERTPPRACEQWNWRTNWMILVQESGSFKCHSCLCLGVS